MKQNKTLQKCVGHALHVLMMTLLFLWCSNVNAAVQGTGVQGDPYVLVPGETYKLTKGTKAYCKYVATETGKFSIPYGVGTWAFYTDATYETSSDIELADFWNGVYGAAGRYVFPCEAGKTYYLATVWNLWDDADFFVEFRSSALPVELVKAEPVDKSVMSASTGTVDLTFNQPINHSGCVVTVKGKTYSPVVNGTGVYLTIDLKKQLIAWYNDGTMKEGDDIKVEFTGVKSKEDEKVLYNGDGKLTLTYKAAAKPLILLGSVNTPAADPAVNSFKSYYMAGDAAGVVTLNFSGAVDFFDAPTATLTYGDIESEEGAYVEEVPVLVDGNNVAVILKGKLRDKETIKYKEGIDVITLNVKGVKDENGNYAYSDVPGALGSYFFTYNYNEVVFNPSSEWSLNTGKTIIDNETESIECWLEKDGATFEGVDFTYTEGGVEKTLKLQLKDIKVVRENGEMTVTIPMPNVAIDADTRVKIALTDVERPDGKQSFDYFNYAFECSGRVAQAQNFSITSALYTSADGETKVELAGATMTNLEKGSTTVITTNRDSEIGYLNWTLVNKTTGENIRMGYYKWPVPAGDGTFLDTPYEFKISWYDTRLLKDNVYELTVEAFKSEEDSRGNATPNIGTASFVIYGATEAYVYSDVVMKNDISNPVTLYSADETTYTVEFSAPVEVTAVANLGSGSSVDCEVTKVNDESTDWIITFPEAVRSWDVFDINVFAKDAEGKAVVKTENGLGQIHENEENSWFTIQFTAEFNKEGFDVTPASESVVEKIDKITFSCAKGITPNWNINLTENNEITIYNRATYTEWGRYTLDDIHFIEDPDDWFAPIVEAELVLPEPITEPGIYEITVPSEFFNLGEQFEGGTSPLTIIYYEVKGAVEPSFELSVDPAGGNVEEIPATIVLTAKNREVAGNSYEILPTLKDEKGNEYALSTVYGEGMNQVNITLENGAITADGTYTLTVPVGAVIGNDETDLNAELVVVYVIGGTGIDNIVANAGGKVDVYTVNGVNVLRNADAAAVKALGKGLYIINGKKVVIK